MISRFNFHNYYMCLARQFSAGVTAGLKLDAIEEGILKSPIIKQLENSDDSFYYNLIDEDMFYESFHFDGDFSKVYDQCIWMAMVYMELFFEYRKSFSYLFLILPLKELNSKYDVFHEMDISHIFNYFEMEEKQHSLLYYLCKKNNLTLVKVSLLTKINFNTIDKYNRSNKYLFNASYANINKLAKLFEINPYVFLNNLELSIQEDQQINLNSGDEIIDNLLFYAFLLNITKYGKIKFDYTKENRMFVSSKCNIQIIDGDNINQISNDVDAVILYYKSEINVSDFQLLDGANEIYAMTPRKIYKYNKKQNGFFLLNTLSTLIPHQE